MPGAPKKGHESFLIHAPSMGGPGNILKSKTRGKLPFFAYENVLNLSPFHLTCHLIQHLFDVGISIPIIVAVRDSGDELVE